MKIRYKSIGKVSSEAFWRVEDISLFKNVSTKKKKKKNLLTDVYGSFIH